MKKANKNKTLVIGIGGGGQNIINYFHKFKIGDFKFITINSDERILKLSSTNSILFSQGKKIFKKFSDNHLINKFKYLCNNIFTPKQSYGCGGDAILGEILAKKHIHLLKNELKDINQVFVISGFGGGFGTGATPVIVDYIKQFNIKLIAIITTPFSFEGKRRSIVTNSYIEKLKSLGENLIVINNEDILIDKTDEKLTIKDSFDKISEQVLIKFLDICKKM